MPVGSINLGFRLAKNLTTGDWTVSRGFDLDFMGLTLGGNEYLVLHPDTTVTAGLELVSNLSLPDTMEALPVKVGVEYGVHAGKDLKLGEIGENWGIDVSTRFDRSTLYSLTEQSTLWSAVLDSFGVKASNWGERVFGALGWIGYAGRPILNAWGSESTKDRFSTLETYFDNPIGLIARSDTSLNVEVYKAANKTSLLTLNAGITAPVSQGVAAVTAKIYGGVFVTHTSQRDVKWSTVVERGSLSATPESGNTWGTAVTLRPAGVAATAYFQSGPGDVDYFSLDASGSQRQHLLIAPEKGVSVRIVVSDPWGGTLADRVVGSAEDVVFTTPVAGQYLVKITGVNGSQNGKYGILWLPELGNRAFEDGFFSFIGDGVTSVKSSSKMGWSARVEENSPASLMTSAYIPANNPRLSFAYRVVSPGDGDMLRVRVNGTTVRSLDLSQKHESFVTVSGIDLSVYAGKTVQIEFLLDSVGSKNAVFDLDDISVTDDEPPPPVADHIIYYPEGYRNDSSINEYVTITNPNDFAVNYTVIVRYETGARDAVIHSGSIAPNTRGGHDVTLRDHPGKAMVRLGVPYAVEIRSDGPLGATMSHYDFGTAIGESFTPETSTRWAFAEVEKGAGIFDFLVFYNPGDAPTTVTATLYPASGDPIVLTYDLGAFRRGGFNLSAEAGLTPGKYGVVLEATRPIVAAISHYVPGSGGGHASENGQGYGALGQSESAARAGVFPGFDPSSDARRLIFFNPGGAAAQVTVTIRYENPQLPVKQEVIAVAAHSRATYDLKAIGMMAGERASIHYSASAPVVAMIAEARNGQHDDALGFAAATSASKGWLFADGYMGGPEIGTKYFEHLTVFNPNAAATQVEIAFVFTDGSVLKRSVSIDAQNAKTLTLHADQDLINKINSSGTLYFAYSMRVMADVPIVASMQHWDLNQQGGFATIGTAIDQMLPL